MKKLFVLLALALVAFAAFGAYKTLMPPEDLYATTGNFAGCPARPSCVSSVAADDQHRVAALAHTGDTLRALSMLREVVERQGGKIETESSGYLHAVFQTPTLHLRDDLELLVLPDGKIEVRSASRFAYKDFGVNRNRVEKLRQAFETVPAP